MGRKQEAGIDDAMLEPVRIYRRNWRMIRVAVVMRRLCVGRIAEKEPVSTWKNVYN